MKNFPFNQPEKTKDCGYRCMYYAIKPGISYDKWLDQFRFFSPIKSGITFTDICTVLEYYGIEHKFTQLTENGLFIVYSGCWLKHGHYFAYENGTVLCSTKSIPERMRLSEVITKLESKTVDGAFRCLKIK